MHWLPLPHRPYRAAAVTLVLALLGWVVPSWTRADPQTLPDRAQVAEVIRATLGSLPDHCKAPTTAMMGPVERRDELGELRRITFTSCGESMQAFLAVPKGAGPNAPVVIALHQTTNAGANEVMGLAGDPSMAYGRRFYQAGFVVVAPDEFIIRDNLNDHFSWSTDAFYRRYPSWSASGRMLHDHRVLLDALTLLGRTPSCVAAVGHSLGAYNALMLAALDERVDAVVSSAGFEEMGTDGSADRWARQSGFVYVPALAPALVGPPPHAPPWDFSDVLALIAPRPTLLIQGTRDDNWTHPLSVTALEPRLSPLYRRQADFDVEIFEGPHSFPAPYQELAIRFVHRACASLPTGVADRSPP